MLLFKVIPFVKQKDQHQSPQVSSDEDDGQPDSPPLPGIASSSEFYSSFRESIGDEKYQPKNKRPMRRGAEKTGEKYESELKTLFKDVTCNNIRGVKRWFEKYYPGISKKPEFYNIVTFDHLSDHHGCSLVMMAVGSKSHDTLEYLLDIIPDTVAITDNRSNSLSDVANRQYDKQINHILESFQTKRDTALQQAQEPIIEIKPMFCSVCNMSHTDSNHDASVVHVFNENKPLLEINEHLQPDNVGYKIMSKTGWTEDQGLGPSGEGKKFLMKTIFKTDRTGIGGKQKAVPKVTHFEPKDASSIDTKRVRKKVWVQKDGKKQRKIDDAKKRKWETDLRMSMNDAFDH